MSHADRARPPEAPYDPAEEWLLVAKGEVKTDQWHQAVGVVQTDRWMLCIRGDYAVMRWSFAPADDPGAEWRHKERQISDLAHIAHRRHLSDTAS